MSQYNRNPSMFDSKRKFRCYNCNRLLINYIQGNYELKLTCPRCKTEINVKCKEAIPICLEIK